MFQLFSTEHFLYLFFYSLFIFLFFLLTFLIKNKFFFYLLTFFILLLKIAESFYRWDVLGEHITTLLPLHFCNIALVITIIAVFTHSTILYKLSYFWSLGAIFALLTPEVRISFPHLLHLSFFLTHFYLILTSFYALFILKIKPTFFDFIFSFISINIIGVGVFFINSSLKTNYMFINYKPSFNSPLDYFGDWPFYILVVNGLFLLLSFLFYKIFKVNTQKQLYR